MENKPMAVIAITFALVVLTAWLGYELGHNAGKDKGFIEGSIAGQEHVKQSQIKEMESLGITHIDLPPYPRVYMAPVSVSQEQLEGLVFRFF